MAKRILQIITGLTVFCSQNSFTQSLSGNLQGDTVKTEIHITDTIIESGSMFYQKTFLKEFEIFAIGINDLANFVQTTYLQDAIFLDVHFKGMCAVIASQFHQQAIFRANTYEEKAAFRVSTFYGYSEFRNSTFYKGADFQYAAFKDEADFSGSVIFDTLNFSFIKIDGNRIIDLTKCSSDTNINTSRIININLTNTDINKVRIDYLKFRLYFEKEVNYEDRSNVYLSLLNNFKRDGYNDSYELLDKEYQHFKNTYKGGFFNYSYDILQRFWWNYGYNKEYIFYWIVFFILLFTLVNYHLAPVLNKEVYAIDNLYYDAVTKSRRKTKVLKKYFLKLYFSFLYTAIVFFAFNVKFDKLYFTKKYLLLHFLMIYTLGIICLAYLANYILKS